MHRMLFRKPWSKKGLSSSISRRGNCYDNTVAESFFATLKREYCFRHGVFATRALAKRIFFEYIENFYNTKRKHSTIGYFAPNQFEAM